MSAHLWKATPGHGIKKQNSRLCWILYGWLPWTQLCLRMSYGSIEKLWQSITHMALISLLGSLQLLPFVYIVSWIKECESAGKVCRHREASLWISSHETFSKSATGFLPSFQTTEVMEGDKNKRLLSLQTQQWCEGAEVPRMILTSVRSAKRGKWF